MNVFVLCTGRCGSVTFVEAARHITNYSAAHESLSYHVGLERFRFPDRHIEADNRLAWLLGRLDAVFGDHAFYVHLKRDRLATAKSFEKRVSYGIMSAYHTTILMGTERNNYASTLDFCLDYVDTVNENIKFFLRDKTKTMEFRLEEAEAHWPIFWERIGAEGDLLRSQAAWRTSHNAS